MKKIFVLKPYITSFFELFFIFQKNFILNIIIDKKFFVKNKLLSLRYFRINIYLIKNNLGGLLIFMD